MKEPSVAGGSAAREIRLVELLAAMSLATELGNGSAPETALESCLLAVQLGQALGLSGSELSALYYLPFLRYLGCTPFACEEAWRRHSPDGSGRIEQLGYLPSDHILIDCVNWSSTSMESYSEVRLECLRSERRRIPGPIQT